MTTIQELIHQHAIYAVATPGGPANPDFKDCHAWTVRLRRRGQGDGATLRSLRVPFYTGSGISAEPDAARVLDCLLSDASSYENARDFEDWASDLGFDADSRRAEQIFKKTEKLTKRLKQFLGARYHTFLEAERL